MINEPIVLTPWIPTSGPGAGMPTREDADECGHVLVRDKTHRGFEKWDHVPGTTWPYWHPLPPLPKPKEKGQEEKDWEKYCEFCTRDTSSNRADVTDAIAWGRSDGRAQLAREALGLFENVSIAPTIYPDKFKRLHELLTKAAGEKP